MPMPIDISHLTEAELFALNRQIVERIRFMQQARAHGKMLEFQVGERVSFQPDGRPVITGMLVKYNKKTVTVITDAGEQWNVSPAYLRKVIDAEATKTEEFKQPTLKLRQQ
ncbi:MAG: hypothetical protein WEB58_05090 [Planctomycetaceae bacterium]